MTAQTGNNENAERGLLPYPVIIAATKGDPELCAFHGKFPQHHFRVCDKITVYGISLRRGAKAHPFRLLQGRPVPFLEK